MNINNIGCVVQHMYTQDIEKIKKCITTLFSISHLLPSTTNGKFSGSLGDAWMRNSSLQLSKALNVLGAVTSKTKTQQSAPL